MEKIEFIFDSASKLLEASKNNEKSINNLIKKSNKEIDSLNSSVIDLNDMKYHVEDVIKHSLDKNGVEISNKIIDKLTNDFSEANELAKQASKVYEKSVKFSVFRIFLFATILFALLSGAVFYYYKTYLPEEIVNMQFEKAMLTNELDTLKLNILKLEKIGAKTKIEDCDGRPCFEIEQNINSYKSEDGTRKLYIIKGY